MTTRQVPIDVDEGSWMNVDVSPDGRTIAFDLLGDIYTMPIAGGTPTRIAEGLAYEQQPRFSPDGRRIAFISDRGGGDNIWIMNADGIGQAAADQGGLPAPQPAELEPGRPLHRRQEAFHHRPLARHRRGLALPRLGRRRRAAGQEAQRAAPEGAGRADLRARRQVASISPATSRPGAIFEYAQNSNTDLFDIERYELDTGEVTTAVSGVGGSVRPTPSPDGKKIAFVRRERARSKLYVKDLVSGEERKIYDALDQDVQETWAVTGVYPNMAWTPDSRSVVFWAGGKIRRVDADGGGGAEIPFRVNDTRPVIDAPHPQVEVAPDRFQTRMPRWASVSPDGRQVVFESLGKLWIKPMAGGAPRRLIRGDERRLRAVPVLVARRPDASSSSAGPTRASAGSAPSRRRGGAARDVTAPARPLRPAALLARRQDDRLRERRRRRVPDLAALVGESRASTGSPPTGGTPVRVARGRRRAAVRRRQRPRLHDRRAAAASASWSAPT